MTFKYEILPAEMNEDLDGNAMGENRRRTKLEKTLFIIAVASLILVFIMIATIAALGFIYQKNIEQLVSPNSENSYVCLTPECIKTASKVLSNLDESVDPCNDFFRFACGGWSDRSAIPEDRPYESHFSQTQAALDEQLRVLLGKEPNKSEPHFIQMAYDIYNTCMDLESVEKLGAQYLKKDLKNLGGWPVVEGNRWNESNFNWIQTISTLRKMGYLHDTFLDTYIGIDAKNNTLHRITLSEAVLGMPDRSYYLHELNDSVMAAYLNMMVKSAKLLDADEATVQDELLDVLHFESALANFSLPREEKRDIIKQYNMYTVKELQDMAPQIPWLKYLKSLGLNDEISADETLIVSSPDYVKKFTDLITTTKKRVIANCMLWRVVQQSMPYLSKVWRDIHQEFATAIHGTSKETPRWKHCLHSLEGSMGKAISSYYVKHYFKEESKDAAFKLFYYIHKEFVDTLDKVDWMDEETRKEAKAKAKSLISYIGYPDELLNNTALHEIYENLTIPNESYFDNYKRINKWAIDYVYSMLRKPNIKGEWKKYTTSVSVNAFYKPEDNGIEFPAGILHNNMFNKDRPYYMNFGSAGFILAHEITHGFDDMGQLFNKDGNMVNWWDKTTKKHFESKVQCIIDQYNNYTAENGMKLNGRSTQGENIADNGGLKHAYKAYLSWVKENGPEQQLPGLKYTPTQLLLISTANTWCDKFRPEGLKFRIITGTHSPGKFRILGMMSNFEEFSKEFNCPQNSTMNRKNKCHVW